MGIGHVRYPTAGSESCRHAGGAFRFDPDDPGAGGQVFHVSTDAGDQTAATDRHKYSVDILVRLFEDLGRVVPSRFEGFGLTALEAEIRRFLETVVGQKPADRRLVREVLAGALSEEEKRR